MVPGPIIFRHFYMYQTDHINIGTCAELAFRSKRTEVNLWQIERRQTACYTALTPSDSYSSLSGLVLICSRCIVHCGFVSKCRHNVMKASQFNSLDREAHHVFHTVCYLDEYREALPDWGPCGVRINNNDLTDTRTTKPQSENSEIAVPYFSKRTGQLVLPGSSSRL